MIFFFYLFYFGFSILYFILWWAPWVEASADSYRVFLQYVLTGAQTFTHLPTVVSASNVAQCCIFCQG